MLPPGHIAVGCLLYELSTWFRFGERPELGPILVVAFGSLFADLVDKPLAWGAGFLPMGRTLAHSLLLLGPLCLLVSVLAHHRGNREYGIAFAVGALSHSILDAVPILWNGDTRVGYLLWPYSSVTPYDGGSPTVLDILAGSLTPYLLAEVLVVGLLAGLWYRYGPPRRQTTH